MPNLHYCPGANPNIGAKRLRTLLLLAPLAAIVMAAAGCAKVADPQPPEILVPAPASDLKAIQYSDQVVLTFSAPSLNTNGSAVTTLRDIEIFRLAGSERDSTDPIPDAELLRRAEKLATISSARMNEYLSGQTLVFHDPLALKDRSEIYARSFRYAVRFINRKNQTAGLSNQVLVAPVPIPLPPAGLKSTMTEHFIGLTWTPPEANLDGSTPPRIVGYNLYRSEDPDHFPSMPLNPSPLLNPEFEDRSFQFDRKYYYVVSIVGSRDHPYAESLPSEPLLVAAQDIFPPGPPGNLNAVLDGGRVILLWSPPPEEDVAGYYVYRKEEQDQAWIQLQKEMSVQLSFRDATAESGKIYDYEVCAVDSHGNKSVPARARIEVP